MKFRRDMICCEGRKRTLLTHGTQFNNVDCIFRRRHKITIVYETVYTVSKVG